MRRLESARAPTQWGNPRLPLLQAEQNAGPASSVRIFRKMGRSMPKIGLPVSKPTVAGLALQLRRDLVLQVLAWADQTLMCAQGLGNFGLS